MSLSDLLLKEIWDIKSSPSSLDKERILKRNKDSVAFRKILHYTYNPFLRFHIRKIPGNVRGMGFAELNHETWVLLNKLSLRKLSGIAARESLFEHINDLTPAAATIFKLVVRKDLKCGIATKTINKIMPGLIPTFDCQLVEDWNDSKVKWPMLIGPKIDGTRGEKRGGQLFTRRGHRITGLDHILNYMNAVDPNMETSGELWIPGMPFRRSDGIMRSNKPEKTNARYAIFDIPSLGSLSLDERLNYLSRTFYPLESNPLPPVCYIPHLLVHTQEEVDKMYNYWRSRGYEGLVAKDPKGLVKQGKSFQWMRRVNKISAEYKIIDVYESEERPGLLGGIVIEGGIRVGSGFTLEESKKYWEKPSLILGKYATIEAKEKTAAGSLRQPIFKAIRWDIKL